MTDIVVTVAISLFLLALIAVVFYAALSSQPTFRSLDEEDE